MPKSAKARLSQNWWCNKPTILQFQGIVNTENLMLSKRYGSTEVDRRTWLHVPSGTRGYNISVTFCCLNWRANSINVSSTSLHKLCYISLNHKICFLFHWDSQFIIRSTVGSTRNFCSILYIMMADFGEGNNEDRALCVKQYPRKGITQSLVFNLFWCLFRLWPVLRKKISRGGHSRQKE